MELESGEELIWKGRPAYHLRYPFLAFLSLFGILNINGASIGDAVDAASTILFFGFLVASLVSLIVDKGRKYYLTNRRVIAHNSTLLVPDLSNVRLEQSRLGRFRGVGNVYFDSRDGRWIAFQTREGAQPDSSQLDKPQRASCWRYRHGFLQLLWFANPRRRHQVPQLRRRRVIRVVAYVS